MASSANNPTQERRKLSRSKSCFRSCFGCLKSESKANNTISKKVAGERSKSARSARKTVPVGVEGLGQNSTSELKEEARVTGESRASLDDRLPNSERHRKGKCIEIEESEEGRGSTSMARPHHEVGLTPYKEVPSRDEGSTSQSTGSVLTIHDEQVPSSSNWLVDTGYEGSRFRTTVRMIVFVMALAIALIWAKLCALSCKPVDLSSSFLGGDLKKSPSRIFRRND